MFELVVGDAAEKICLILDAIHTCTEPYETVDLMRGGIVAGRCLVEFMTPTLLEEAELDHFVAHDIGVGCETFAHCPQSIVHHVVPIFLMERHDIKRQTVETGDVAAHLNVLLGRAVALAVVKTDAYIE